MWQRLGQHFLVDDQIAQRTVDALEITHDDVVIEIGPGHGVLTKKIIEHQPRQFIAIEKDPRLANEIRTRYDASVHDGDVRRILATVIGQDVPPDTSYKIIGNIPYYLTGFLLRQLSELPRPPARIVLIMQKEVGERLAARPPKMNKLAASIQFWAAPILLFTIPSASFRPAPDVASAAVSLVPLAGRPMAPEPYYALVHRLFQQPRKNVANNLISKTIPAAERMRVQTILAAHGIHANERPQNLDIPSIVALAKQLSA
jgi:16S rRNA (adenine1518-N6/adenine1519-N6)-dimethyltransferase